MAEAVLQLLMESDVEGMIGDGRYERSGERTTWRNGYRDRTLDTRLGALQLRIRSCGRGAAFRRFSKPARAREGALVTSRRPGSTACRPGGSTIWCRRWAVGDQESRFPSSVRRSTSVSMPSSTGRSPASGRICGSTHLPEAARRRPYRLKRRIIAVAANTDGRREIVGLVSVPRKEVSGRAF